MKSSIAHLTHGALLSVAPSRERGLKSLIYERGFIDFACRSFAGAWIEMGDKTVDSVSLPCRSFAGAWIEISGGTLMLHFLLVSLLRGSVD